MVSHKHGYAIKQTLHTEEMFHLGHRHHKEYGTERVTLQIQDRMVILKQVELLKLEDTNITSIQTVGTITFMIRKKVGASGDKDGGI